jgi:hypothetical protein
MVERPWKEDAQLILSPAPGAEGLEVPREEAKEGVGIAAEREGSISLTSGPEEMAAWGSTGLVEVSVTGRGLEEGAAAVVVVRGLGFHCVVFGEGFAAVVVLVEAARVKVGIWKEEDRRGRRSWRVRDRMVAVMGCEVCWGCDVDGGVDAMRGDFTKFWRGSNRTAGKVGAWTIGDRGGDIVSAQRAGSGELWCMK